MHGSYKDSFERVQTAEEIFYELTGKETQAYDIKADHFEMIQKAIKLKKVVVLRPKSNEFLPQLDYSVEMVLKGPRQVPICKIRIPRWVTHEWTGDWSK